MLFRSPTPAPSVTTPTAASSKPAPTTQTSSSASKPVAATAKPSVSKPGAEKPSATTKLVAAIEPSTVKSTTKTSGSPAKKQAVASKATAPKSVAITKVGKAKRGFTVSWKKPAKAARAQISGYQIRWSTKSTMKGAKKLIVKGAGKTSAKVSKLKGGTKYYVQVRTYRIIDGKRIYSNWSKAKPVTTKRK